jgi:hypothetical protein
MADLGRALSGIMLLVALPAAAQAASVKLGDNATGSRAQPAHIIPLRDADGDTIQPGDRHVLPFRSLRPAAASAMISR